MLGSKTEEVKHSETMRGGYPEVNMGFTCSFVFKKKGQWRFLLQELCMGRIRMHF